MDIRLWIWPKKKSVEHAIDALREASIAEHHAGAISGDGKRIKAQEYEAAQKDMAHELEHRQRPNMRDVDDKSVHGNSAPISQANNNFHEHSKLLPWLMVTALFSGFALATSIFCYTSIHDLHERDRDELVIIKNDMIRFRVQLMSNDALLLREGIKQPGDMWYGPEGNLEYGRKDQPRKR